MNYIKRLILYFLISFVLFTIAAMAEKSVSCCDKEMLQGIKKGSVIFIHPDGASLAGWTALRSIEVGPDHDLNWDRLEHAGLYRGNVFNSLVTTSHAGATIHAYGVKVPRESFGRFGKETLTALSGKNASIMEEAQVAGYSVALINSGFICEPGTAVYVADADSRDYTDEISLQVIESGADILMAGGEAQLLPEGQMGFHGHAGIRKDGINLIEKAKLLGYTVVMNRDQMEKLPDTTEKVLGVFSGWHTFNDVVEEEGIAKGIPLYNPQAPSVDEMLAVTLKILAAKDKPFLVVLEEEGSDNFGNKNNAVGTIEALRRSDRAIGVAQDYLDAHPDTLIIMAADSDAGGLGIMSANPGHWLYFTPDEPITHTNMKYGSPVDGIMGTGTPPFVSAPDQFGNQHTFGICWANNEDIASGVIARSSGLNSHMMGINFDNTDVYRMMYATLFGLIPGEKKAARGSGTGKEN